MSQASSSLASLEASLMSTQKEINLQRLRFYAANEFLLGFKNDGQKEYWSLALMDADRHIGRADPNMDHCDDLLNELQEIFEKQTGLIGI